MLYYLDTSIWLDIFEDRDEPNLPKSKYARELINKIVIRRDKIIISNAIYEELLDLGYNIFEIKGLFREFRGIVIYMGFDKMQYGKAKDLAYKRDIPKFDALHAILARDNNATLISRDYPHFKKLTDITTFHKPEEVI